MLYKRVPHMQENHHGKTLLSLLDRASVPDSSLSPPPNSNEPAPPLPRLSLNARPLSALFSACLCTEERPLSSACLCAPCLVDSSPIRRPHPLPVCQHPSSSPTLTLEAALLLSAAAAAAAASAAFRRCKITLRREGPTDLLADFRSWFDANVPSNPWSSDFASLSTLRASDLAFRNEIGSVALPRPLP